MRFLHCTVIDKIITDTYLYIFLAHSARWKVHAPIGLLLVLVDETRVHDFGWNDSTSHAQCQVLIHNVPVLVLRCLKVLSWTWVSYCWTFINQINIPGDCWSRHNSLYETVWASRPHFPEFLLSSIYLWSWQVAVSRDGEAKYIAIINYLVMPLHLSCHPNIDKQD